MHHRGRRHLHFSQHASCQRLDAKQSFSIGHSNRYARLFLSRVKNRVNVRSKTVPQSTDRKVDSSCWHCEPDARLAYQSDWSGVQ